ncbi:hypothetical protein EAS54_16795 [Bradyrhizobium guangzhouense]|nr:hypothetical protein EAS54_16795 [Bradyrhizobium guangzhouense]
MPRLVRNCARGRGIQYAAAHRSNHDRLGVLDRPVKPGDDSGVWGRSFAVSRIPQSVRLPSRLRRSRLHLWIESMCNSRRDCTASPPTEST